MGQAVQLCRVQGETLGTAIGASGAAKGREGTAERHQPWRLANKMGWRLQCLLHYRQFLAGIQYRSSILSSLSNELPMQSIDHIQKVAMVVQDGTQMVPRRPRTARHGRRRRQQQRAVQTLESRPARVRRRDGLESSWMPFPADRRWNRTGMAGTAIIKNRSSSDRDLPFKRRIAAAVGRFFILSRDKNPLGRKPRQAQFEAHDCN